MTRWGVNLVSGIRNSSWFSVSLQPSLSPRPCSSGKSSSTSILSFMCVLMAMHSCGLSPPSSYMCAKDYLKYQFFSRKPPSWSPVLNHHCVEILLSYNAVLNYSLIHILCSLCTHFPSPSWVWVSGFVKIWTLNFTILHYLSTPERTGQGWWLILVLLYSGEQTWKACFIIVQWSCLALL